MFLKIENPGFSDYRALTLLGVSTTRYADHEGTIGQFGSGFSNAISVLLRHNIDVIVFIDRLRLDFFCQDVKISDNLTVTRNYKQIMVRLTGKLPDGTTVNRTEETGFTTEMGLRDWPNPAMGIREFVSNAIDRSVRENKSIGLKKTVDIVEDNQVRASAGTTRVFLPLSDDVYSFYTTLGQRFLHFREPEALKEKLLPKRNRSLSGTNYPAIYKQGVFVREDSSRGIDSVFDYNFDNELRLDEARQVDDYAVREAAAKVVREASSLHIASILKHLIDGNNVWEGELDVYEYIWEPEKKKQICNAWKEAWAIVAGDSMLITADLDLLWREVQNRGYRGVYIKNEKWRRALRDFGVRTDIDLAGTDDIRKGRVIEPPTTDIIETLDHVWLQFVKTGMHLGMDKPAIKMFSEPMKAESETQGYYRENTVFIHKDISVGKSDLLHKVMIEELSHYTSKSSDLSRDFQQHLINFAYELMKDRQ